MRFPYFLPRLLLLLGLLPLATRISAQSWATSPVTVCPGQSGVYTLNISSTQRPAPSALPIIAGGRLIGVGYATGQNSVAYNVSWNDDPNGGKITPALEYTVDNGQTWRTFTSPPVLVAKIRSVNVFTGFVGALSVPYCSTAAFTINGAVQNFPNVPNEAIPAYIWEVPTGWGVSGANKLSFRFGTTPNGFDLWQGTKDITLTPLPGGDVRLRVFPYSSTCDQQYNNSGYTLVGAAGFIDVRRNPTVTLTTIPFTLTCGDQRPRTFTAQASQPGANFLWTLPSGWVFQGPANGATITAIPSGTNGGKVMVAAQYTCGSTSFTTPSAEVTISYTSQLDPVAIVPNGMQYPRLSCGNDGVGFRATGGIGASSFQWSASNGATVAPSVTTSANTLVGVSGGYDGPITVTVTASNPAFGCTSSSASTTVYFHNRATITPSTNPLQLLVSGSSSFYAPNGSVPCGRPVQFDVSGVDFFGNALPTTLHWIVDGRDYYTGSTLATVLRQSQVTIVLTNACGYDDYYYWDVPVDGNCGTAGGGHGPIDNEPCTEGCLRAYPNPANSSLSVEQGGGEAVLYNAQGRPVRQQQAGPGRLRFDTCDLPTGLYHLQTRDAQGRPVRQQIQISH